MLTVELSTKDRYESLAHTLQSILTQTYLPKFLIIFDDSVKKCDLRQSSIFLNIFKALERKGIKWRIEFTPSHGQVKNHIKAVEICETEFIYRCDDDHVLENNVLHSLVNLINQNKNIGAVSNTILHPDLAFPEEVTSPNIEDVLFKYAINFSSYEGIKECQHLYSSFISRAELIKGCYATNLSNVGHREESICTYNLYKKGFKLLNIGNIYTWHMKENKGGIRSYINPQPWIEDDQKFALKIKEWDIKLSNYYLMVNNGGIGDNYSFRHVLPLIKEKYKDKKLILGTVYPNIYFDESNVEIISIHSAAILARGSLERFDPYKIGFEERHAGSVIDLYKKIYNV